MKVSELFISINSNRHRALILLRNAGLILTLSAPQSFADEHGEAGGLRRLRVNGFLSQGHIKTTNNNNFFGKSSFGAGSFDLRELGLTASLRPITKLQLSGQLLHRTAGEGDRGGIRIDFGFLDYNIMNTPSKEFGVRLGRTKNPFGLYNDTRDVPFTRPSILLPQSIYFDRTRNLALASDGLQLYGESRADWGNLTAQFGTVYPQVGDRDTEAAIFGGSPPGSLRPELSYIGRVLYERPDGRFNFALSSAQVNVGYQPGSIDRLSSGSFRFTPVILSAQYNTERWSITSEYALRMFRLKDFGVPRLEQNFMGESAYLQGIYRFYSNWEAVLRYDLLFMDREDRSGKKHAATWNEPAHTRFARTLTFGLRWNINPSIMLSAEYHRVNGTAWLSTLDNPDIHGTRENWDLFAAQISYRF